MNEKLIDKLLKAVDDVLVYKTEGKLAALRQVRDAVDESKRETAFYKRLTTTEYKV